jgi:prepilin-type N-terminal cleavage/methylation domain-containing protein
MLLKDQEYKNKKGEKIMTKRFGFTLAEVLITLGIIGVVAAMTMPTLINQTNGAQYKAAYKKALSAISQGVTLNVALDDESFADLKAESALPKRMNVVKNVAETNRGYNITLPAGNGGTAAPGNASGTTVLFFNDGSLFGFVTNKTCTEATPCKGYIDVNGAKGPNKVTTCTTSVANATCIPDSPTDVYPVRYYDQTVLPNSPAARGVLYGK